MSEKKYFYGQLVKTLFMRFFIMFYVHVHWDFCMRRSFKNAAMEFRFQDVTIEKHSKSKKKRGTISFIIRKILNVKRKISFSAKGMNLSTKFLMEYLRIPQVDYVINGTDIVEAERRSK